MAQDTHLQSLGPWADTTSIQENQMEKEADMDVDDNAMNDIDDVDDAQDAQCVDIAGAIETNKELEVAIDQKDE